MRCLRSTRRLKNGSSCAYRIRSGSIHAVWMAASTIPTPDGKAADCGPTTALISSGISKAAKAQRARSRISRFGLIRSRDEIRGRRVNFLVPLRESLVVKWEFTRRVPNCLLDQNDGDV